MTAQTLLNILDRNNTHGILLVRDNGSVYEIIHLENNRFEGTQLRYWFFNNKGKLMDTDCNPAPNGEMDLLAEYADNIDKYGLYGEMPLIVGWC